jgi:hypothetical protein
MPQLLRPEQSLSSCELVQLNSPNYPMAGSGRMIVDSEVKQNGVISGGAATQKRQHYPLRVGLPAHHRT